MGLGHEKLDVYRSAIKYVGWSYRYCESLKGLRNAKDQLLRAYQAIPLNIAEGNGAVHGGSRSRYRFRPRHRWEQRRNRSPIASRRS